MPGASDYDLLVVVGRELTPDQVNGLRAYHEHLARRDPASLFLEGDYAPVDALTPRGTTRPAWWFRDGSLRGPEFMLSADNIMNMRDDGLTVLGPAPREVLPEVTADDVRDAVREMLAEEPDRSSERSAAREILGIARSLAALESGRPTANAAGLRWAREHMDSRWHAVLERAAEVRRGASLDEKGSGLRRALDELRASLGLT